MRTTTPSLLPLLRSRAQGDIYARLFLDTDREYSIFDLADAAGVSGQQALREVRRLEEAGLVSTVKRGNRRLVSVNTDNPVFAPMAELLSVTFGALPVLRDLMSQLDGVDAAFIYGSWAARYSQQPGPVPGDIDVLVLGDTDPDRARDIAKSSSRSLGREVSIRRMSADSWASERNTGFRETVMSRPRVHLMGREV
ncbi:ArsR family transcriptional regulator [Aeromicrobium sp. CF3.5]|uniref:ArsR family transcriptional regulator n=1 Tax=Aeromicrobium sp. CF3.5 TaxID=3373078 RepID=UPI003EE746F9